MGNIGTVVTYVWPEGFTELLVQMFPVRHEKSTCNKWISPTFCLTFWMSFYV